MALAALIVSAVAVLVSLSGTYVSWRHVRAAEEQARTARDTLTRHVADARIASTPRFTVRVETGAADRDMRLIPTALLILNGGTIDFEKVQVELSSPIPGLNGFRTDDGVAMVANLELLRSGEVRRVSLSLDEAGPRFLRGSLAVRAEAANGDSWNTTLPLHWDSSRALLSVGVANATAGGHSRQYRIGRGSIRDSIQAGVHLGGTVMRILLIILALSALGFTFAALIGWLS